MADKNINLPLLNGMPIKLFDEGNGYSLAKSPITKITSKTIHDSQEKAEESFAPEYYEGEIFDVEEMERVNVDVEKMCVGDLTPQVSHNGVEFYDVKAKNINTGNMFSKLTVPAIYSVDVSGWNYFRSPLYMVNGSPTTVTVYSSQVPQEASEKISPVVPSPLKPDYERIVNGSVYTTTEYDSSGTAYGVAGPFARKSTDEWITSSQISYDGDDGDGRFSDTVKQVKKLSNGSVLVATADGKMYRSDENETNFTEVLQFETPGAALSSAFGLKVYDNIVVCAEYGVKSLPENARKAYLSMDYGVTFERIFEGRNVEEYHLHDITYDPYSDLIWICSGDGLENRAIYYSGDFGDTWKKVKHSEDTLNMQFTMIVPLPDCVLFLTDSRRVGAWRWVRDKDNGYPDSVEIEEAFTILRAHSANPPIATNAVVTYGEQPAVYFGFTETLPDEIDMKGAIWATSNGYHFYPIWRDKDKPNRGGTSGMTGMHGIFGLSDDGYMVGYYTHDDGDGNTKQLIKIKAPQWV